MKKILYILIGVSLLLSCNSRKNANDTNPNGIGDVVTDTIRRDSLCHSSLDEFTDGHMLHPHRLMASILAERHLHHLMGKVILPTSRTTCVALTLHLRMTWMTTA
jgi:hypothetical protein